MDNYTSIDVPAQYAKPIEDTMDELAYAQDKWGNEFDSKNTLNDWLTYIMIYAGRAGEMGSGPRDTRANLIKVIGLAMNAVKWLDKMPKRHYDKGDKDAQ